jgi:hypothetical protein
MGPGSAEQREERCAASGTRAEFALAAFLHQTRLTNLRRGHSVPRTQRSAQRCAAEPGSIVLLSLWSRLCGAARRALHRVRDTSGICSRRRVVICPSGGFLTGLSSLISDFPKNISVPTPPKSPLELFASHPTRGAYRDRHGRGVRMRWTRQRQARNVMQGGFPCGACERSNGGLTNDVVAYGEVVWS